MKDVFVDCGAKRLGNVLSAFSEAHINCLGTHLYLKEESKRMPHSSKHFLLVVRDLEKCVEISKAQGGKKLGLWAIHSALSDEEDNEDVSRHTGSFSLGLMSPVHQNSLLPGSDALFSKLDSLRPHIMPFHGNQSCEIDYKGIDTHLLSSMLVLFMEPDVNSNSVLMYHDVVKIKPCLEDLYLIKNYIKNDLQTPIAGSKDKSVTSYAHISLKLVHKNPPESSESRPLPLGGYDYYLNDMIKSSDILILHEKMLAYDKAINHRRTKALAGLPVGILPSCPLSKASQERLEQARQYSTAIQMLASSTLVGKRSVDVRNRILFNRMKNLKTVYASGKMKIEQNYQELACAVAAALDAPFIQDVKEINKSPKDDQVVEKPFPNVVKAKKRRKRRKKAPKGPQTTFKESQRIIADLNRKRKKEERRKEHLQRIEDQKRLKEESRLKKEEEDRFQKEMERQKALEVKKAKEKKARLEEIRSVSRRFRKARQRKRKKRSCLSQTILKHIRLCRGFQGIAKAALLKQLRQLMCERLRLKQELERKKALELAQMQKAKEFELSRIKKERLEKAKALKVALKEREKALEVARKEKEKAKALELVRLKKHQKSKRAKQKRSLSTLRYPDRQEQIQMKNYMISLGNMVGNGSMQHALYSMSAGQVSMVPSHTISDMLVLKDLLKNLKTSVVHKMADGCRYSCIMGHDGNWYPDMLVGDDSIPTGSTLVYDDRHPEAFHVL